MQTQKLRYEITTYNYNSIPGSPIAYWASNEFIKNYENETLGNIGEAKSGIQTENNDLYLKFWFEVNNNDIAFNTKSKKEYLSTHKKWIPQVKGGDYRRWYGNLDYVINWENDGKEIKTCAGCRLNAMANEKYYCIGGITWSHTTSSYYSARFLSEGILFNVEAPTYFVEDDKKKYILAFLNNIVAQYYFDAINPTVHYLVGNVLKLPIKMTDNFEGIGEKVDKNIKSSKEDWDSFETSWDFKKHPLI